MGARRAARDIYSSSVTEIDFPMGGGVQNSRLRNGNSSCRLVPMPTSPLRFRALYSACTLGTVGPL